MLKQLTERNYTIGKEYKYQTNNPIAIYLMWNFFDEIGNILNHLSFKKVLNAGCGDGIELLQIKKFLKGKSVYGLDIDPVQIKAARKNIPSMKFILGDIYKLQFKDSEFDLVLSIEVLEHLVRPEKALKELSRVSAKHAIFSVPNEPLWRILNLLRGYRVRELGNGEGHIQHWSSDSFKKLVSKYFNVVKISKPIPFTILLCSKK